MIDLLGKRPFTHKADEMDKWLDENSKRGESSAPPPIEPALGSVSPPVDPELGNVPPPIVAANPIDTRQ